MKILKLFFLNWISSRKNISFFPISFFCLLIVSSGYVQGQSVGKPSGNASNFFNTDSFGRLLGHSESGSFGSFSNSAQWIGIGQPLVAPNVPNKIPAYGLRNQWAGQAGIFALTGSGSVKDLSIQWGGNPNSKVRFNFASSLTNPSAVTEVMTLLSNGNVGIGVTTPSEKLTVDGNIRLTDDKDLFGLDLLQGFNDLRFQASPTSQIDLYLRPDGNVGVGTTNPIEKLTVNGNIRVADDKDIFGLDLLQGFNDLRFQSTPSSPIDMYIATNGNIGMGTSAPIAPLHVNARGNSVPSENGIYLFNETNSPGEDAIMSVRVAGSNAGDPYLSLDVLGESGWSVGIDNDDENKLKFAPIWSDVSASTVLSLNRTGNVGIGTTNPTQKLHVNGNIQAANVLASAVNVNLGSFPDYVFADDYDLMPLKELETYIDSNKHLPEMPSEAEVLENGVELGRLNTLLVEKVEELTLHIIELNKRIELLENQK
ncbi:MAG: hypothetical protein AAGA66_05240 [Bacteroidota bacterium]